MKLTNRMVDLLLEAERKGGVVVLAGRRPDDIKAAERMNKAGFVVLRRPPEARVTGFWVTDSGREALKAHYAT